MGRLSHDLAEGRAVVRSTRAAPLLESAAARSLLHAPARRIVPASAAVGWWWPVGLISAVARGLSAVVSISPVVALIVFGREFLACGREGVGLAHAS